MRHQPDDADCLGLSIGSSMVTAALCRQATRHVETLDVRAAPIESGSVRGGVIIDHRSVVAAIGRLDLPDVPAVVAVPATATPASVDDDDLALVLRAWRGRRVIECRVAIEAVCRARDVVVEAGVRSRGWIAADLVASPGVIHDRRGRPAGPTYAERVAIGAALWRKVETWPVGLPGPPAAAWTVTQVD